jgi:predicted RNA binding protein YcfA (HicA-like mRNA interferase family)
MKLPIVSWKDVEQVLGKLGYVFDRQRGSHRIYVRAQPPDTISVPQHREIAKRDAEKHTETFGSER